MRYVVQFVNPGYCINTPSTFRSFDAAIDYAREATGLVLYHSRAMETCEGRRWSLYRSIAFLSMAMFAEAVITEVKEVID